ncbi:MAG: signal peptidase II [Gemmatimonadaceae bacterium]|jgi:signal peptidase II|nr:signal peptidase II [Gemmatimonadaceae bacterium]
MASGDRPAGRFWPLVIGILALDVVTKLWAERALVPMHVPHDVIGDWVRLTLLYNPGAAFGLYLGDASRWIFMALTVVAVVIILRMYAQTRRDDVPRTIALAMIFAGAIGNLIDRIRSDRGVVDFIDIGIGATRWPTFNVADIGVSCGAVLLALVLWREDRAHAAQASAAPAATGSTPAAP